MMFVLAQAMPSLLCKQIVSRRQSGKFYPKATHTYDGIAYICKNFSWPYGFPSHSNPGTPGVILEVVS